jgi:hypothetical protein
MNKAELVFEKIAKKEKNISPWKALTAGTLGGAVSAAAISPLDLVKTRHKDSAEKFKDPKTGKTMTVSKSLQKIYTDAGKGKKGLRALWSGTRASVTKLAPANAIAFATFALAMDQLKKI